MQLKKNSVTGRSGLLAAVSVLAVLACQSLPAMAETGPAREAVAFSIPEQPLSQAIAEFSRQSRINVLVPSSVTAGRTSRAVTGEMTPDAALQALLEGSALEIRRQKDGAYLLSQVQEAPQEARPFQLDRLPAEGNEGAGQRRSSAELNDERRLEQITVTGTNIRGIAPDSSPAKTYSRSDLEMAGAATAQDFIQTLPANFGGGSNPSIAAGLGLDNGGGANSGGFGSYGASVNLRGVGSGGTLVLLNGRRIAPSSAFGDFADISMIPASALERIETLTDGASSIYGSDAVAGVMNFILRDDFDGLEASARYGTGTEGGAPDQYRASLTGGRSWENGNVLGVYEYFSQEELGVSDRGFAAQEYAPSYLLPRQERHSFVGSVSQDITPALKVFADATWSRREARQFRTDLPAFTFQYDSTSEAGNLAAGGSWRLAGDWYADLSGGYSEVTTRNVGAFDAIGDRRTSSSMSSLDAKLSGPVLSLPAGEVKVALGGHVRHEALEVEERLSGAVERKADRDVAAVFGEAFVPLIAPEAGIAGVRRLELNLSGRYSDYSDFGTTANPKAGVLYSPVEGLNLRSSFSTSFKAPPLGRVGAADRTASLLRTSFLFPIFGLTPADPSLADVVVLTVGGTDKDLEAEKSEAFTAGADFEKSWGDHAVTFSASWFDIDFRNRINRIPIPGNVTHFDAINIAFANPGAFPSGSYTFNPSADELSAVLASLDMPVSNPFGLNPAEAFFISRVLVETNTSRTKVKGLDFDVTYARDLAEGTLSFGLDGTYLAGYRQQATDATPVVDYVDTLFNPVDLKLRARAGYARGPLTASLFINYVDDYKVDSRPGAASMSSWTTMDASFAYDTGQRGGLLQDTVFRFSVTNLLDTDPPEAPFYSSLRVDGYDPANASPLGRFLALEVTRRF